MTFQEYTDLLKSQLKMAQKEKYLVWQRQINSALSQKSTWKQVLDLEMKVLPVCECSELKYTSKKRNAGRAMFEAKVGGEKDVQEIAHKWVSDVFDEKFVKYITSHSSKWFQVPIGNSRYICG